MLSRKEKSIQWHPACYAALNLEFADDKEELLFQQEIGLNELPHRLDALIIKKRKESVLKNEIGKIFSTYNIVEYKSPGTTLDFDSFLKGIVYVLLYKLYPRDSRTVMLEDMSLTFIREGYPRELFKMLKKYHFHIEEKYKGIYYVYKEAFISTQIIVSRQLDTHNHVWLNSLAKKLNHVRAEYLLERTTDLVDIGDKQNADLIWEIVTKKNTEIVEKIGRQSEMCQAIVDLFRPEFDAAVAIAAEEKAVELAEQKAVELAEQKAVELAEQKAVELAEKVRKEFFVNMIKDGWSREQAQKYAQISNELVLQALAE